MAQYGKSIQIKEKDNSRISSKTINQSILADFITGKNLQKTQNSLKIKLIFLDNFLLFCKVEYLYHRV